MEQHLDEALDKVGSLAKELERMKDAEMAEPSILGTVAEPEFQYGADAFEAYQQSGKAETAVVSEGYHLRVVSLLLYYVFFIKIK